jgi:thiamine biosynthesis lipoprotein
MTDHTFDCMGTDIRLLVPDDATAAACRATLEHFDAALSRFRPDSELTRLNTAPEPDVPASSLLRTAIQAGLMAAELTGGLVDPTLTPELEAAGYDRTRRTPELSLAEALATAPARRPAKPHPAVRWARVRIGDDSISREPGIRLDTGGTGKGLAADLLALRLPSSERWAIDCGGDLRVNGPFEIEVRHPLTGETAHRLELTGGGVATSGIDTRIWRAEDGTARHHILDPATGAPAWTGVIGATAVAPTALEAEALAKAALLSGPAGAGRWLRRHGGITFLDDGQVIFHGAARPRPLVRLARVHPTTAPSRRRSNSPEYRPVGDTAVPA